MGLRRLHAARLLARGQALAARQRHAEACALLTRAAALHPQAAGIHLHLALAHAELQQWPQALAAMAQALRLRPGHAVLLQFLAQIHFDREDYPQALACCQQALDRMPHNVYARILQALCELALDRIDAGYRTLSEPLPLAAGERFLLRLGRRRPPTLAQQANVALQSRLLLLSEAYLLRHAAVARPLAQQLRDLWQAAESSPLARGLAGLDALCTRGVMALRRGLARLRWQGARQRLHLAYLQAEEAYYLGHHATAAAQYRQLLPQLPPRQTHLLSRLVDVHLALGEAAPALSFLRRLLSRQGEHAPAAQLALCGELLCQLGRYEEARPWLAQALARGLREAEAHYALGLCHLHAGDRHAARQAFAQAVSLLHPGLATLRLEEMHRVWQHEKGTGYFLPTAEKK